MAIALLMCPLVLGMDVCRLVRYFGDEQGIKVPEQIVDDYNRVGAEFEASPKAFDYVFHNGNAQNIFQYKDREELIASVFLVRDTFHGIVDGQVVSRNVVLVYSMYVSEKHRGRGYSRRILKDAADSLNNHYKMNGDFLLVLHLCPKDRSMELAFSIYYNLNFRNGGLSMTEPSGKKCFLEEILGYGDPCDVIDRYDEAMDRGRYMIMVCEYSKLCVCERERYSKLMEYGSRLRSILERSSLLDF
ncbi:hypothetical protein [Encephalitozoon cuniculi GB-M1]|uniref:N-acetyltransferase domain-containing protein n=2 Tax=Encephalitozoon cuniculi TaxID=6035 RepID=Q8SUM9_ENCCU|nr:uncharacterized protein ECU08_1370 [Encephalitozoon cuniculi GB-M1]AGE95114.1 hypothetical protein ECU08_1370 [Encephalitozoon cuniculi]KMV65665.1 hypothetical protein M970_081400 [Encephalitozoon cuniculi EcunIII-L]UYI27068.1 acetyl-transferase [Encephalitozoon cuniculi]CAD26441.1 hypothetical protein [Encephalitozoon cuniculi GB-M1]